MLHCKNNNNNNKEKSGKTENMLAEELSSILRLFTKLPFW